MSVNTWPISARTAAIDPRITASGSYTLPQYAFIPHPSLQHMATGAIAGPSIPGISAGFVAPVNIQQRPYPTTRIPVYGVRQVLHYKSTP